MHATVPDSFVLLSRLQKNWNAFNEQLHLYGLCLRKIESDGNCFFRSVADQILGQQDLHQQVRETVCEYMLDHPLDYAPFVWDETFEQYIGKMKKSGCWGGAAELSAAAKAYGVHITVHQLGAPRLENRYDPISVTPDPNHPDDLPLPVTAETKTIHLAYHDAEHYSSVRNLLDGLSQEPATPIVIPSAPIAAAASSSSSSSSSSTLTHQEVIVTQSIACANLAKIRKLLKESWNDPNVVVEILYAEQAMGLDVNVDHDHAEQQDRLLKSEEAAAQANKQRSDAAKRAAENHAREARIAEEQKRKGPPEDEKKGKAATEEDGMCVPSDVEKKADAAAEGDADPASGAQSEDERTAIAAVQAFESFDRPPTGAAASSSSSSSTSPTTPPLSTKPPTCSSKRLSGRDKKLAQKREKMLAEKQNRVMKGAVKKEREREEKQEEQITQDLGAVRI
jgi:OTU domain-containing protein 3